MSANGENGVEPDVDELSDDDFAYEEVTVESDDEGAQGVHNDLELALRTVKELSAKQPAGDEASDQSARGVPAPGEASRRPEARDVSVLSLSACTCSVSQRIVSQSR